MLETRRKVSLSMDVVLFGTGKYYEKYKKCFANVNVTALIDNDPCKQNTKLDGVQIHSAGSIKELQYDQIYLLSAKAEDMKNQLLGLGVDDACIFEPHEIYRGLGSLISAPEAIIYESNNKPRTAMAGDASGCIAVIVPNLGLNGAEIALYQMVDILKSLGFDVCVASLRDGALSTDFQRMGVPVIIMGMAAHDIPLSQFKYLSGASAYILNTIEMYMMLQDYDEKIKALWWLHDSELVYSATNIRDELLRKLDLRRVKLLAVSDVARKSFLHHYGGHVPICMMPYGLRDWAHDSKKNHKNSGIVSFAVVAAIAYMKAQDVFAEAVSLLPREIRKQCEFLMIGAGGDGEFWEKIKKDYGYLPEIKFLGELGREEILKIYSERIDVLVCPSRSDTLPTVTVEAMMYSIPSIVSDAVGTASMIADGNGGAVVATDDAVSLSKAMMDLFLHPDKRLAMGKNARTIYEKEFNMEAFKNRVCNVIEGIM